MCGLSLNIYGFYYSVNVCSLQLSATFKVCVLIPDLFSSTFCPFCISLKSALAALMGCVQKNCKYVEFPNVISDSGKLI